MATTEQGTTYRHDEQMDKLRISNGRIQVAPLGQPLPEDAGAAPDDSVAGSQPAAIVPDGLLPPGLRRNFIIPPKERALECKVFPSSAGIKGVSSHKLTIVIGCRF